jgi:hypothetical protein
MKLSLSPKLLVSSVSPLSLNANVLFFQVFSESHPCMTKLRVLVLCLSYFTDNSSALQSSHSYLGILEFESNHLPSKLCQIVKFSLPNCQVFVAKFTFPKRNTKYPLPSSLQSCSSVASLCPEHFLLA